MNTKILYKLLWKDHPKSLFVGGIVGMFIGLSILLLVFQLYKDVDAIFNKDKSLLSSDYIVINKHVTALNLSTAFSTSFDEQEIQELQDQDFIKDIGAFVSSQFKVSIQVSAGDNSPSLYTEAFFESVDDRFLDISKEKWEWEEGQQFVPIIIPRAYLTLYNFGFAESQQLPKISEQLLNMASFDVIIHAETGKVKFKAGIVGLSDRLNSIIAPKTFLDWANQNYGSKETAKTNRLVLETEKIGSSELAKFLEAKAYQTEKENKTNSKIAAMIQFIVVALSFLGSVIIILSMMVFLLSYQLILTKSTATLKSLLAIGIKRSHPLLIHSYILAISTIIISILSVLLLYLIHYLYIEYLAQFGFELEQQIRGQVVVFAFAFSIFAFLLSFILTKQRISKLFDRL